MELLIDRDVLGLKPPKTFWRSVRQLIGHLPAAMFSAAFAVIRAFVRHE